MAETGRPRLPEPASRRRDPARPAPRRAHRDAAERIRSAARLGRAAQTPRKLNGAPAQAYQAVTLARPGVVWNASNLRGGTASMPFREKRPDERVFSQLIPLSRPVCRADWRKSARLFAYRPGVHCRDGLSAGGSRIRTIGPAREETAVERGIRGQPSSSRETVLK